MSNPFGGNPFNAGPFPPPQQAAAPPAPSRDEVNVLATLSVIFAFVFAPAGALFGHLGLVQIRRTGERGRDRALIGTTLSYVFITVAVVALIVEATLPRTTPAAAPTTPPTPTTTTAVVVADLDGLLPSLDDVKTMTGDDAISGAASYHRPTITVPRAIIDRPDCWGAVSSGDPTVYASPLLGFSESDFKDTSPNSQLQWSVGEGVAAYAGNDAAHTQLANVTAIWRRCGGATTQETWPGNVQDTVTIGSPSDAVNGISTITMKQAAPGRISAFGVHAIAQKSNVVADVFAFTNSSEDNAHRTALAVVNAILGKIPG
ncbi:hypothetical protein A5714_22655 [Mycobacterium sp. E2462]|uniref:sensor domain-containing protein n=1 Tax=Mycobacterium sp. E2462 TaxID=1834133 RepID=UPI0007FED38B|nr:sensor domain-containing protein [Mycobacterium sp. E2462]OBI07238.1 hypothetical protein A5714_22655 [Mycobacterium sp. E2462]